MTKNKEVTLVDVYKLVEDKFDKLEKKIETKYVSKAEFIPVKTIVYGGVGLILTGVMTALVAKVVVAFS